MSDFWLKQKSDKPLFPDLLWSRPENKSQAGKLLIIGGNLHGLSSVAESYNSALKAGIGQVQVILPASLEKTVGKIFPEAVFAPSTASGSFARLALDSWLEHASQADGALLAGDFGKNSETAILMESFINKYDGQINIAGDTTDYFLSNPDSVLVRYNFFITNSIIKIQKLVGNKCAIKQNVDLAQMVNQLSELSAETKPAIITHHQEQILVAFEGKVSSTPVKKINESELAAYASVWALHNPSKLFEALTTAAYDILS